LKKYFDILDPAKVDYDGWIAVGMYHKDIGCTMGEWEQWSRRDPDRYKDGDCATHWKTFRGSSRPITEATMIKLVREQGAQVDGKRRSRSWDELLPLPYGEYAVVDRHWLEDQPVTPTAAPPHEQLIEYMETLFHPADVVGLVVDHFDGKPTAGVYNKTAGELIACLRSHADIEEALGRIDKAVGAWIRANPLDGQGCRDANVTAFRHALVESDSMPIEKQRAIYEQLELPIAAMVHSGNKSLHAIVKIDAASETEYRDRVDFLYEVCQKNGLDVDRQNRNPSRLSRMPGADRNGRQQFLVATNVGQPSWEAWKEYIEEHANRLPKSVCLADVWDELPPLSPPLIDGILRQGHKMLISGPSKAGKSFCLIELCVAVATGGDWLGFGCAEGAVLYVNMELDEASCFHRFVRVVNARGDDPAIASRIHVANWRGTVLDMERLVATLTEEVTRRQYMMIVIDPIYKLMGGDENSAEATSIFCNYLDRICRETGAAICYCHHHSKGAQGQKRLMDRASGSGVFARDPDAILDLIELNIPEEVEPPGDDATAWRLDGSLREFRHIDHVDLWFNYPVHTIDADGDLADAKPDFAVPPNQKATTARREQGRRKKVDFIEYMRTHFRPTIEEVANDNGVSERSIRRYAQATGFIIENNIILSQNPKADSDLIQWNNEE